MRVCSVEMVRGEEKGGSPKAPVPPAIPGGEAGEAWAGLGWGPGAGSLLSKIFWVKSSQLW